MAHLQDFIESVKRTGFAAGEWNAGPRVVKWLGNGTSDGQDGKNDMRYHANCSLVLKQTSWHCSDCFATIAQIQKKITSFCHSDKNRCGGMPAAE